MANKDNKNNIKDERVEDTTLYGEFVPSFHQWITLDKQRQVASHMEKVTETGEEAAKEISPEIKSNNKKRNTKQ
ncbi:hypothetical protein DFR58_13128 [Anaerobacterium chartisolvens]|uniref:Uncharacterized protein n=1 Tax=Anaerobacterium chartisolvens TaxID=1297424 RepID=A0A369AR96_9FIRM|nr:hypothetical protein [Anaerobacterium chartisolvens]RCX09984.1 hypothetical protein DFR58_13128 [Anaerobacterium chartisolvens]